MQVLVQVVQVQVVKVQVVIEVQVVQVEPTFFLNSGDIASVAAVAASTTGLQAEGKIVNHKTYNTTT